MRRVRTVALLMSYVIGSAGCGLTVGGYGMHTAAKFLLPGCCVNVWLDYEADTYDKEQQAAHFSAQDGYRAHREAAVRHASLPRLADDLLRLEEQSPEAVLRPGLPMDRLKQRLGPALLSEEVLALYAWHDGARCGDLKAVLFGHCLLSLEEALRMKQEDREMYLGTPARWHPLLSFAGEVLYVLDQDKPVVASPVWWVSLLSPDELVAFTNVRTMLQTHLAWREEGLWPPDALDATQRKRFEALHAQFNPSATLPW